MQYYGLDWMATVFGLSGAYLLGSKSRFGFILFMAASLSWISVGFLMNSLAVMLGSTIFFVLHLRGLLSWSRKNE